MMRTHTCGELRASHAGAQVTLCGWVHHRRDHGTLAFIDLRDASGTVQVVFPDGAVAHELQREFCVKVTGEIVTRKAGTENPRLPTGEIEVRAAEVEVLSPSLTPPFLIEDGMDADENLRLQYRYLDLRRPEMQHAIRLRAKVVHEIRTFLEAQGFNDIETPILFKSTPEGARDFLVPSRLQPGSFYALPQSPQMLKQLLMVSGFDRYYQIAKCFRDEDARADRQLEFTQLDLEMSFVEQDDVLQLVEALMVHLWRECLGVELEQPFPRIAYEDAIRRFGHDYVDLRYGMELADVHEVFANTSLGIFRKVLESGGVMRAFAVPGAAELHHNELRKFEHQAMERGAKGLAWIQMLPDGTINSPIAKHLSTDEIAGLQKTLECGPGDLVLMAADQAGVVNPVLGALRMQLAKERGLIPSNTFKLCWVLDYPYFHWDPEGQKWEPSHHPFTAPLGGPEVFDADPATVRSSSYDLVCNGTELASGSIRIHHPELQRKVFDALGISEKEAEERFGFFLEAFKYGPPPHGGIAPGIDRIVMKMLDIDNIRDVVPFPKNKSGIDPLSGAPTPVDDAQLKILGLKVIPQ